MSSQREASSPLTLSPAAAAQARLSPTLALNERVSQLWAAGEEVYHLGFGEARLPVPPKIAAVLAENAGRTSYPPAQGIAEVRRAVAAFYGRHFGLAVQPEQVIAGPGSKALLFAAQMALDATLLLPTPSWVSYAPQARLLGRGVQFLPGIPAAGYTIDPDDVARAARTIGGPAALVLNSPNNPTGQMIAPEIVRALAQVCRTHGITILSDEIYALTAHGTRPHLSPAAVYPEGTVVFGGLSKHLALGGWRLGVAVVPPGEAGARLMGALQVIAGEIWSSPSAPVQHAAAAAYAPDAEIEAHIALGARLHALRTNYLWEWLAEYGVPCPVPEGAFYLFPSFNRWRGALAARGVRTSDDLARLLLEEQRIAALPGTAFGVAPEELSLRLATSYLDMETEAKAAALLEAARGGADGETLLRDYHPHLNEAARRLGAFVESLDA